MSFDTEYLKHDKGTSKYNNDNIKNNNIKFK